MTNIKKVNEPIQPVYKVIPLAFDESMSYYECICSLINKMNEMISIFNNQLTQDLEEYIDEKFNEIMINAMYDAQTETLILYLDNAGD